MGKDLLDYILAFGMLIAGFGYLVGQFRKGKNSASAEQITIYEGLNKALKEEVATLRVKLDDAVVKIDVLEAKVTTLTASLGNYEILIIRSLKQYWESHPEEAKTIKIQ